MTAYTTHVDVAADDGIVAGGPRRMLRLKGAAVAAGAFIAYTTTHEAWWLIALMILLPDLSAIGFLAGNRVGAHLYYAAHTTSVPAILLSPYRDFSFRCSSRAGSARGEQWNEKCR